MKCITAAVSLLSALLTTVSVSAAVRGVVLDENANPVVGAAVAALTPESTRQLRSRILGEGGDPEPLARTVTDSAGRFMLELPRRRVAKLVFTAPGRGEKTVDAGADEDIGVIVLRPFETRRGKVTAAGRPVAGAKVWVVRDQSPVRVLTADANGTFEIDEEIAPGATLLVRHPGFAPKEHYVATDRYSLDLSLDRGVTIGGTVVAADGRTPLPGARIAVDGWDAGTADENGAFSISEVPRSWRIVSARLGDRAGFAHRGSGTLTIRMKRAAAIAGRVTIRDGSAAGAVVRLVIVTGDSRREIERTIADERGQFRFEAVEPATYDITASHPEVLLSSEDKTVSEGETASVELKGLRFARAEGKVVDDRGEPVALACIPVRWAPSSGSSVAHPAISGRDGRVVIRAIPPDHDFLVMAVKAASPPSSQQPLRLRAGETRRGLQFVLPEGYEVRGRAVDGSGNPIAGVNVLASEGEIGSASFFFIDEAEVKTDAEGRFSIRLGAGTHTFLFNAPGWTTHFKNGIRVPMPPDGEVRAVLEPAVSIHGRTLDANGSPLAGLVVETDLGQTNTAEDGSFTLTGFSPGPTELRFRDDSGFDEVRQISAPAEGITIEFDRRGAIRGTVVDADTKRPITTFNITRILKRRWETREQAHSFNDEGGGFSLSALPLGPVTLVASAPGYVRKPISGLELTEEKPALEEVVVALERGARISGTVTLPDLSAAGNTSVSLQTKSGPSLETWTNTEGEYLFDAAPRGEHILDVRKKGFPPLRRTVILGDSNDRIDVRLERGFRLGGVAVTDDGSPLSNVEIRLSPTGGGRTDEVVSDTTGRFVFEGLERGGYRIEADRTGFAGVAHDGVLVEADLESFRLTLSRGATITGRITGVSPADLRDTWISAFVPPTGRARGSVQDDGTYRIEGVPQGTARVLASLNRGGSSRTARASVDVAGTGEHTVDVSFHDGATLRGRLFVAGRPLVGAEISFLSSDTRVSSNVRATSGVDGAYVAEGLAIAPHDVIVEDVDTGRGYTLHHDVSGSEEWDIRIETFAVRGKLLDATTGKPIVRGWVEIQKPDDRYYATPQNALTGENGEFVIGNLAAGEYELAAGAAEYADTRQKVRVDERAEPLKLVIAEATVVRARVTDARTGMPVQAGFRLRDGAGQLVLQDYPRLMPDGTQALDLPKGSFSGWVSAGDFASSFISIPEGAPEVRIALTQGGSIRITSRGERRKIRLFPLFAPFSEDDGDTRTVPPGSMIIPYVAPGRYSIQLLGPGDAVERAVPVTVEEGKVAEVIL
jgi:hypothetical protein